MKALREAADLSQEELAHRCDLHRTYVSGIERGVRNPTLTVLEKLSAGLQVSLSKLVDLN